jgi:hypothetical protein
MRATERKVRVRARLMSREECGGESEKIKGKRFEGAFKKAISRTFCL